MDGNGAKFIYYQNVGGYFLIVEKKINPNILSAIKKDGIEVTYKLTWTK